MCKILKIIIISFVVHPAIGQVEWNKYEAIRTKSGSNPAELAKNITSSYDTQEEKIQAIYYWVTHNITYDVKLYEKMKKSSRNKKKYSKKELKEKEYKEVVKTLKSKKGVCQQYSNVFQSLCDAVGIQSIYVSGYAKANPKKSGLGEKHAWNAVYLDGNYYLLDATFGAGYVDDDKKFHFSFDPNYFIADPDAFKMNHLPTQSKWQLTGELITKEVYKNNPGIGSGYYKYGIDMLSPNAFRIDASKDAPLKISFLSSKDLEELSIANLRKPKEVLTEAKSDGDHYTISIDTENLKSGIYGIFNGQDLLFTYRISIN